MAVEAAVPSSLDRRNATASGVAATSCERSSLRFISLTAAGSTERRLADAVEIEASHTTGGREVVGDVVASRAMPGSV
jgi:hypothetical protein